MAKPNISVVIPVFNEEEVLPHMIARLKKVCENLRMKTEVIWIDDGSTDHTAKIISDLIRSDHTHKLIRFSRNFGHQSAVTAGLAEGKGESVVVIDADLQDPPELIEDMVKRWRAGTDVVYGVRRKRKGKAFLRMAYFVFYRAFNLFSKVKIPLDSGDFSLMDRKVVDAINALPERLRFVRGLRVWVGFKQEAIEYDRPPRASGKPKYTFKALYRLAVEGFASFSLFPLKIAQLGAFCLGLLSLLFIILTVIWKLKNPGLLIPGWATLMIVVLLIGSFQMFCIYLLGAYVGRIYLEVKGRPPYVIMEKVENPQDEA